MNNLAVPVSLNLVHFLNKIKFESIPVEVILKCQLLLIDLIGVSLAAKDSPEAVGMREAILASGAITDHGSSLWGTKLFASSPDAAMYNGTLAHCLELDDFGGADHSGAVIIPAMFSVINNFGVCSGEKFIEAMVIGYEVSRRVLESAGAYRAHNNDGGWHSTATCGAPGAAMAVAHILDLTEDQKMSALGFALSMAGGTWAFSEDGAMSKRIHPGWAAQLGVKAALFAQSGITGPKYSFEAPWGGFFNTHAKHANDPDALLRSGDGKYKILRSGIKPYPCCRDTHSVIDIMVETHFSLSGDYSQVEKVRIFCIPEMYQMLCDENPENKLQAQLSLQYCGAVALVKGKVELSDFTDQALCRNNVRDVMNKIEVTVDDTLEFDAEPHVLISFNNRESIKRHVPYAKGAPQNPMSTDEVIGKFKMLAANVSSSPKLDKFQELVFASPKSKDVYNLVRFVATMA